MNELVGEERKKGIAILDYLMFSMSYLVCNYGWVLHTHMTAFRFEVKACCVEII